MIEVLVEHEEGSEYSGLSEISIEARSIMSSLAATRSLSAVAFLPLLSLLVAPVFKCRSILAEKFGRLCS